jgi:hypothetical protein
MLHFKDCSAEKLFKMETTDWGIATGVYKKVPSGKANAAILESYLRPPPSHTTNVNLAAGAGLAPPLPPTY